MPILSFQMRGLPTSRVWPWPAALFPRPTRRRCRQPSCTISGPLFLRPCQDLSSMMEKYPNKSEHQVYYNKNDDNRAPLETGGRCCLALVETGHLLILCSVDKGIAVLDDG